MSKPLVIPPDAEHVTIDYLAESLAARGDLSKVGVDVPSSWTTASEDYVQVALDGTPTVQYPVLWIATVRVTCWSSSPTKAKDRARLCEGLLLTHPGDRAVGVVGCLPGTGVLRTKDPDTKAALASITVRMKLRGLPA